MADRTESSISIDAAPAAIMGVIADFEAYPEWTGAVKEAEIRTSTPQGRAKTVWFDLQTPRSADFWIGGVNQTAQSKTRAARKSMIRLSPSAPNKN